MAKLSAGERARREAEREAKREAKRRAKEEERARRKAEREEARRRMAIEKGRKMKRKPGWLYWLIREQNAKEREHGLFMAAGRAALALARAIRKIQRKIMGFLGGILDHVAGMRTPEARIAWSHEPWTPQDRTRYNWGKRQELAELWEQNPDGVATQDTKAAAADAKRRTLARRIDHAKAIDRVLDGVMAELAEDERNVVRSSLERGYAQAREDIYKELAEARRAIDADREGETRIADLRDLTAKGDPRRTAPETRIPRSMPRLGNYGESVVFGAPSPDQVKTVLNARFEGKDYSERIWGDTERLAAELKDMMRAAIVNGENSRIVAQRLAQRMGVAFSHAERLVRTEMNRMLNEANLDAMKGAVAEKYRFVVIEDGRTCGRCKKKKGKVFRVSEKMTGKNFPPLHPYCRCTVAPVFAWEDAGEGGGDGSDGGTPNAAGTQKTIEEWLGKVEAADRAKAEAVRENPTPENAGAAAEAQDAAMKAEEARMNTLIGTQKRAIRQGKPFVARMTVRTPKGKETRQNQDLAKENTAQEKEEKRSANRDMVSRDADRPTETEITMDKMPQGIKGKSPGTSPQEEEKALKKRPEGIPIEANFENSKRFGMKVGEHVRELGLNPKAPEDRQKYKDMINKTIADAVLIKRGFYTEQEPDALCFRKGELVILTRLNGEIITAYTTAISRKERPPIEERRWYREMKTIFDANA